MENNIAEKELAKIFSVRLKTMMDEKSISLGCLSEKSGISVKTIQSWLDKKACPKSRGFIKIAIALNCSCDYLVGREKYKS